MLDQHSNISDVQQQLAENPELPVKFYVDGVSINPGYHVTEVRYASIKSIDCGRASDVEYWDEITIQLLDGSSMSTQGHMPASKFLGIVSGALSKLIEDSASFVFFEFAPDNGPIRKLSIESIETKVEEVSIVLGSERAVCKPFQRAKAALKLPLMKGKSSAPASSSGCCSGDVDKNDSACC